MKIMCKEQIKNKNIDVRYAINYEVDVTWSEWKNMTR